MGKCTEEEMRGKKWKWVKFTKKEMRRKKMGVRCVVGEKEREIGKG